MNRMASNAARIAVASLLAGAAFTARAADFYAGKTLSLMINYAPGGPADTEGRLVARYLGKHIPGAPAIVVRNMPGAGGVVGANWLGTVAPADGSTLGFLTGVTSKAALADENFKADMSKYAFVAGVSGISIAFMRTDTPPGVRKPADIMKARDFWVGGLTVDSDKDMRMRMQLEMLGIPHKYITGYGNTADARLAFQRNEIQMYAESSPTYRTAVEPGLVKTGQAIPLWHDSMEVDGAFVRSPEAEGIDAPTFEEFLLQQKGALPKGILWDSFRRLNQTGTTFLRLYVMAPGTPKEAVDAVRTGIVALSKDAEFRAEAQRTMKFTPTFVAGEKAEAAYREKLKSDPAIVAFVRAYIEKGKAENGRK
jgi:tripartite-type tricarboxylate transporter receptor subunit TctC